MRKKKNIPYEDNPDSIKYYVKKYLYANKEIYKDKIIVDFPAGNGITSRIIKEIGAIPIALDLFPEYFEIEDLNSIRANITEGLPLENKKADAMICQEGIEHFSDQLGALKEFNRILKKDARLLITTPNYSSIRSKVSYLLSECERFNSIMPPNELDSIWISKQDISNEIYLGHIFLIGVQKLRVLAKIAGFDIEKIHFTQVKTTSLLLLPLFYPFILISNFINYKKNMRKNKNYDYEEKRNVYKEIFNISINPKILVSGDIMIEFVKTKDYSEVAEKLKSKYSDFKET